MRDTRTGPRCPPLLPLPCPSPRGHWLSHATDTCCLLLPGPPRPYTPALPTPASHTPVAGAVRQRQVPCGTRSLRRGRRPEALNARPRGQTHRPQRGRKASSQSHPAVARTRFAAPSGWAGSHCGGRPRRRAGHEAISFFQEDPAFGASPRVPRVHEVWIRTQAPWRTTPRQSPVSVPGSARLFPLHRRPLSPAPPACPLHRQPPSVFLTPT